MSGFRRYPSVRPLLQLAAGPLIWSFHFALVYAAFGFGGAFGAGAVAVRLIAWAATIAACAAIGALLWRNRQAPGFSRDIQTALAALSLVAVLLETLALFLIPYDLSPERQLG